MIPSTLHKHTQRMTWIHLSRLYNLVSIFWGWFCRPSLCKLFDLFKKKEVTSKTDSVHDISFTDGSSNPSLGHSQLHRRNRGFGSRSLSSANSLGLRQARSFLKLKSELRSLPVPSGARKCAFSAILSKSESEHLTPTIKLFIEGLSNEETSTFAGSEINVLVKKFPSAFAEISPDNLRIFVKEPKVTDATINKILDKVSEHFQGNTTENPEGALDNHFQQLLAVASGGRSGTESILISIATSNLPKVNENAKINKTKVKSVLAAAVIKAKASSNTNQVPEFSSSRKSSQGKPLPRWKQEELERAKCKENLINATKLNIKNKIAFWTLPPTGTKPNEVGASKVLELLQDLTLADDEKIVALNEFLVRPEGGKVLMDSISSDIDKLDTLFKFEKKALKCQSDIMCRKYRLKKVIPNISSNQIEASIDLDSFRAIMSDVLNGYATTIAYSLSVEQIGDLTSAVKDHEQALAMITVLTQLKPSEDDDGGKVTGDKLFTFLSKFDNFSQDIQNAVKDRGGVISGQVRHVKKGGSEVAQLEELVKRIV